MENRVYKDLLKDNYLAEEGDLLFKRDLNIESKEIEQGTLHYM